MQAIAEKPLFTETIPDPSEFRPAAGSCYILGLSDDEDRSSHWAEWETNCTDVMFIRIKDLDLAQAEVSIGATTRSVLLRSFSQVTSILRDCGRRGLYLDITGLPHHIWAPLVRAARVANLVTRIVYVEPGGYKYSRTPTEADIFDLSEETRGVSPLPGFANLLRVDDSNALFVPLLGFEGARFAHLLEQVQPDRENIYPIIGVPGFRVMYPFFTYQGNRNPLLSTRAWHNARYARANCPFSLYYTLAEISRLMPGHFLRIAPIGTKPHALGAVLYALDNPLTTELVYDHPVRKAKRTEGTARVCLYDITPLGPLTRSTEPDTAAMDSTGRDYVLRG
jgi:hypothetical protein